MGHQQRGLGIAARSFGAVRDAITDRETPEEVLQRVARLYGHELVATASDPAVVAALHALAETASAAARSEAPPPDVATALGRESLDPTALASAVAFAIRRAQYDGRALSLAGDDARQAAARAVLDAFRDASAGGVDAAWDSREARLALGSEGAFGRLATSFVAAYATAAFSALLDRELTCRVGPGRTLADSSEHRAFLDAIDAHVHAQSRTLQEGSSEWFARSAAHSRPTPAATGALAESLLRRIVAILGEAA